MKPSKIAEAVGRGLDGDTSMWEDCPERAGDGSPSRRLEIGSGFTLGSNDTGFELYHDGGFSMTMEVLAHDGGVFTGPGSEAVFRSLGARRTHVELDPEELERFVGMVLMDSKDEGGMFLLSDELGIDVREEVGHPVRRICTVSFTSTDGKVSFQGEGEAVFLQEGPAIVGDGFTLLIPMDLLTLRSYRERLYDVSRDTRRYLELNRFNGNPSVAETRRREIAAALGRCRPGSRSMRIPRDSDEDCGWEE